MGKTIIAVDDERLALEGLLSAIHKAEPDANVLGFRNPEEALEYAKNNQPDVAFLDMELRTTNGIEVGRKLRKMHAKIGIIFQTGFREYVDDAAKIHANGYILKPITAEKVHNELVKLV
ncbi:MAG: response regulator [Lachnospiraceae bacterium]|nr:response regulator [Lachnospiraceae bacterium]